MPDGNVKQSPYRFWPTSSKKPVQHTPAPHFSSVGPHSQFASTPRFGTTNKDKTVRWHDDSGIEDPDSSPTLPSRPRPPASFTVTDNERDTILDGETITREKLSGNVRARAIVEEEEEDVVVDSAESSVDSESSTDELTKPLSRKRRRSEGREKDAIRISSSPSQSPPNLTSDLENFDKAQDSDISSSDLESPTTSKTPLRFRPRDTSSPAGNTISSGSKLSFRIPPHSREEAAVQTGLPEAFSPSKRHGKGKDYIPGGLADTLRGWIIGMTAEEQRQIHLRASQSYKRRVQVTQVTRDVNNRCMTVRDEDGSIVMLLGGGDGQMRRDLRRGSRIGLRGGQMYWEIEAQMSSNQAATKIGISALWDVLEL